MGFAPAIGIIGSAISGIGAIAGGQQQASAMRAQAQADITAANYNAAEMRRLGQQDLAASQRKMFEDQRQEQYVQSKVQALAAASGGGAQDPGVVNIQKQIAQQGEYSALSDLYSGQSQNVALQNQANLTQYMGQAQAAALQNYASYTQTSSLMSGLGGIFGGLAKFG